MPLTDAALRNAKPRDKSYKLADEKGLYIEVYPSGGKLWRLKYRFGGKEKRLALGAYPDVTLAGARERRDSARAMLAQGADPGLAKQLEKLRRHQLAAESFEAVAREWFERQMADKTEGHRDKIMRRLERDVFPFIGPRPVAQLTAPEVLAVVRRIEKRGVLETAHRALQNIGQVVRYAVATGRADADPTPALRGALPPVRARHMAAPAGDPGAVGALLRTMDAFKGGPVVAAAVKLQPLLFCRPGELRTMRWADVDLDAGEWRYTVTKTKTEHLVPLSRQAVEVLRDLQAFTGRLPGGWVFPGGRSPLRPMSEAAVNGAYKRLGIDTREELTGHGWRAVARTILHERLGYAAEVIEHQLAHAVPDALGRAYNRTKFSAERRRMMQEWADYLDRLKAGGEVVPMPTQGQAA